MYQLIASDMDGTFLSTNHQIVPKNIAALVRLKELGVYFVPASGRGYQSILDSFGADTLELLEGSFVISCNGAAINRFGMDEALMTQPLSFETTVELFEWARTNDTALHIYTIDNHCYCIGIDQEERDFINPILDYEDLDGSDIVFLKERPIAKVLFCREGLDELAKLEASLPSELKQKVELSISSERYLEFNAPGVSKGAALSWLAHYLNINLELCIACGDSLNDLSMVSIAGLGAVPSNATRDVSLSASYHASASNDDGFIAELVEHFF